MQRGPLRIAVTAGDPAGIGPEIALSALNEINIDAIQPFLICGDRVLRFHYPDMYAGYERILPPAPGWKPVPGVKYLVDLPTDKPVPVPGEGTPATGRESLDYINAALGLWKDGIVDAIVTGPVSKALITKSGTAFTGHTEYIAAFAGGASPWMMMYSRLYRVVLSTTHLPLSDVPGALGVEVILGAIRAGAAAVSAIDGAPPRVAVAGLDPHSGDDGAIGDFDTRVTAEAVRLAREEGIDAEGPLSADTLFLQDRWSHYGLAVAQYHDQGLIPFKMLAFDSGVNVTLGLDIVRTSVDHGTAFDIAGRGMASYSSMLQAIETAALIASGGGNNAKGRKLS